LEECVSHADVTLLPHARLLRATVSIGSVRKDWFSANDVTVALGKPGIVGFDEFDPVVTECLSLEVTPRFPPRPLLPVIRSSVKRAWWVLSG
jgi:hypothetical protein